MRIELNWQKRAVILLAACLVVISVVLALMATREAEKDKLFSERRSEEEQRRAAAVISDRATSILADLENSVLSVWLAGRARGKPDEPEEAFPLILEGTTNSDLLRDIFLVDSRGKTTFPAARPLCLFADEKPSRQEIPQEIETNELWKNAENAEFKLGDFAQAAESYERLLAAFSGSSSRPYILSRIGRCYQRTGDPARALAAFREVLRTSRREESSSGIPLGLMAAVQIGDIQMRRNRQKEAAGAYADLYEKLLSRRWDLTGSQLDFYLKATEDKIRKIRAQAQSQEMDDLWSRLKQREESARQEMTRLENVRQRVVPLITSTLPEQDSQPQRFHRLSVLSGDEWILVSYRHLEGNTVFGLTFDPEVLAGRLLQPSPDNPSLDEDCLIRLTDESGGYIAGEDFATGGTPPGAPRLVYTGNFEDGFPPWGIAVYRSGPDLAQRTFYQRRNFYILLVGVVMAALFLGGYLAIRSTGKELQLAKLKSDFVSTVSHEFRTPLTSIRYLAELLERGRVRDEEKKRQYFRTISGESDRLGRLVENILDFSRIEAGVKEYRMEEADIASLSHEVATRFLGQAAYKDLDLKLETAEELPKMRIDREAISRAVFNLLDNAAKYSGENPRVIFRVWADGEDLCLQVEDNGAGIPVSDQKRVFEKFYRSETAIARNVRGSGIGLTLVAHIVKAHDGKVTLESEPGKGTKVTILLPARPAKG